MRERTPSENNLLREQLLQLAAREDYFVQEHEGEFVFTPPRDSRQVVMRCATTIAAMKAMITFFQMGGHENAQNPPMETPNDGD